MIDKQLLALVRCPETRAPLREADAALVERINARIAEGRQTNRSGKTVEHPLDGGLIREDGALLYPIIDNIPVLLIDEAILLDESV